MSLFIFTGIMAMVPQEAVMSKLQLQIQIQMGITNLKLV